MKLLTAFSVFNVIQFSNCFSPNTSFHHVQAFKPSSSSSSSFTPQPSTTTTPKERNIIPFRPTSWSNYANTLHQHHSSTNLHSAINGENTNTDIASTEESKEEKVNRAYIEGLLQNLSSALDRWIVNGSMNTRMRAYNIILQIRREAKDEEYYKQAMRMATRAGMPLEEPPTQSSVEKRRVEVEERKEWEDEQAKKSTYLYESKKPEKRRGVTVHTGRMGKPPSAVGRSALSNRVANNGGKPDLFMPDIGNRGTEPIREFADGKKALQDELKRKIEGDNKSNAENKSAAVPETAQDVAEATTSEIIAKAGAGSAFDGDTLGIGGLDDVLSQVKRRIWVPLAAPPSLLKELGINPVRGLLLYGLPGCGKTLLARSLGQILSPARPLTVVSGPEIMDRFVGSSEANLREIFDNPPEIYDTYRIGTKDNGAAIQQAALHVIILDEFDAMARARGGRGGGDQGDAGVARDSVVNQLLAKMDGVEPLPVPTLVIGMTNKRSLIEPALLRPGRFEVQIEVPKPKSISQRVSILNVHMNKMYKAGRVLVRDAPEETAASRRLSRDGDENIETYDELLNSMAVKCEGFSGASLAGVARAAASRALERAVCDFTGSAEESNDGSSVDGSSIADCLVTKTDIELAIEDVIASTGNSDSEEDEDKEDENKSEENSDNS